MRTIAIINQKGGCGKTTTSINLAAVLALRGHRTLLVDMDPQSHCALGLAVPDAQIERSTADLLQHGLDGTMSVADVTWQISRGLDLAPSSIALAAMEMRLASAHDKDRRLVQILSTVQDRYDYCIIDCPPSIGLLTFNALRAADEVLIPVETGYFAMQGSVRQEQTIEMLVRRVGHQVRFRVLPTMYDVRTKLAREILSELRKHFGERVLPLVINFNSKLKEAASFGQPITEYDAASRGMQDFEALANWLQDNPPAPPVTLTPDETVDPATASHTKPWHSEGGDKAPDPATRTAGSSTNPALSRAAELVERARALSAKTARLAERFEDDPDTDALGLPLTPGVPSEPLAKPRAAERSDKAPDHPAPASPNRIAELVDTVANQRTAEPKAAEPTLSPAKADGPGVDRAAPAENLREKLAKLYGVRHTPRGVLFVQPAIPPAPGSDDAVSGSSTETAVKAKADTSGGLAIAGDFNNWNPSQTPMTMDENLGVWRACVNVPPGRYRYRLVRGGQWVQDPYNKTVESNPFGELNNIIEIKPPA
ncbi:MAG: AAA family ATPase [Planctomycetota bacterium]